MGRLLHSDNRVYTLINQSAAGYYTVRIFWSDVKVVSLMLCLLMSISQIRGFSVALLVTLHIIDYRFLH